jgi:hypothetical protein
MMSLIARRRFALARWQCAFWMKAMMRICALHLGHPSTSPVVLELLLCLLPRVAPEHAGRFGIGEVTDRNSDKATEGV